MPPNHSGQIANLKHAIAELESQRSVLGDAVVDTSLASLRAQLAELESRLEPAGQQRKLATILFCDVVGSTHITQQLDPEEVLDMMDGALKRLAQPIETHGGHVSRFQGDGFQAIFGLPLAHENDPELAIKAGLAILEVSRDIAIELERDRGISNFSVRVGINTGQIAAGGHTEREYTLGGHAVNLAARLESAAPPDGLLISHDTYRHVRGVFDVELLQPIPAKGFPDPLPVYLVRRAKARAFRVTARGVEGVETRMIGRQAELNFMQEALLTAIEDGEGQIITIVGEAGVGKSRLIYEFQNWFELLPQTIYLFTGRSQQESQNQPYALIRDMYAFRFQIQDSDPPDTVRHKFERGITEAFHAPTIQMREVAGNPVDAQDQKGPNTPAVHESAAGLPTIQTLDSEETSISGEHVVKAHFIGQLIGYEFSHSPYLKGHLQDPQALYNRAFTYLVDYFSSMSQKATVVLLFEDIHWADDSSLEVLNNLGRHFQNLRVLAVCLARSSLYERRPYWGEGLVYHNRLDLRPLPRRESRLLVDEILQRIERVPDDLREMVIKGTEGNPFYIEELIKMLIENEVIVKDSADENRWYVAPERLTEIKVPPTLVGVLQARLDSLPPEERKTLQWAAVVGRVFWDQVVAFIGEKQNGDYNKASTSARDELETLRARELIFRREESAFASSREFIFKHDLLRQATYETVLKKVRRVYHGLVADWLVAHAEKRIREFAGLIGDHLELSGRSEEAVHYLYEAGIQALASYANIEGELYFRRALRLELSSVERARLLEGLGEALALQGNYEEACKIWQQGIEQYRARGDLESIVRLQTHSIRASLPERALEGLKLAEESLAAARSIPESRTLGRMLHQVARAYYFNGIHAKALSICEEAIDLSERFADAELQADALTTLGLFDRSESISYSTSYLEKAIALAENNNFLRIASRAHNNLAVFQGLVKGDFVNAQKHASRAAEISTLVGDVDDQAFMTANEAWTLLELGELNLAEQLLHKVEAGLKGKPNAEVALVYPRVHLARTLRAKGQWPAALRNLRQVMNKARQWGMLQIQIVIASQGIVPLLIELDMVDAQETSSEATSLLLEALEIAERGVAAFFRADPLSLLSTVALKEGDLTGSLRWLNEARRVLDEQPSYVGERSYWLAAGALATAEMRWADADEAYRKRIDLVTGAHQLWEQAFTLLTWGDSLIQREEPEFLAKAKDLIRQARSLFNQIGAFGYVQAVEDRLSELDSTQGGKCLE
jgi:predicted ATPase/class 3 adenylate cyclase